MKTVGKQLQDARKAKEWSPELAARETKIKVERLRELEADDYTNFSSPTYARGFVRTYARALGLDEYKILRQLDNKLPEDDNATFVNDSGVPYMPEPSQVSSAYKIGPGVYVAMGVGTVVLLLIAFILFQSYRVGYFAQAIPAVVPPPATNAAPVMTDTEPVARALPADSNAAPVPLPVDLPPVPVAAASTSTNEAPVAAPVAAASATTNEAPVAAPVTAASAAANEPPVATAVAVPAPPASGATNGVTSAAIAVSAAPSLASTTPLDTKTPPRALPVDLNALTTEGPATAPVATVSLVTNEPAAVPPAPVTSAPVPAPAPKMPPPSLSARGADTRPDPAPETDVAANSGVPPAAPAVIPVAPPAMVADSSPASSAPAAPADSAALTGESAALASASAASEAPAAAAPANDSHAGKRLVLTASRDSYIRVVSLDEGEQVRYSSVLHEGQSISFNDRKYSINVGVPSAVDIALDGINYGPHSDHAEPDTFTVESHQP
jgi:cytoskeleton protein RodZ